MYSNLMALVKKPSGCISSRCCLLVWAYIRLAASLFWTSIVVISTGHTIYYIFHDEEVTTNRNNSSRLMVEASFCLAQAVEIGMLVTFIVAGHKKNAKLYRIYYLYSIVTLVIYILSVMSVLLIDYNIFMENYLTYHFPELNGPSIDDAIVFFVAAIVDICLEVCLIMLVKRQIVNITEESKCRSDNSNMTNEEKSAAYV